MEDKAGNAVLNSLEDDPHAREVAEYLRTGVPVLIPRWRDKFELPYVGPVTTSQGIVERPNMPNPKLIISGGDSSSRGNSRSATKVGLGNPQPPTVGTCRHAFLLVKSGIYSQPNDAASANEKLFGSNSGNTCPSLTDFYSEMSFGKLTISGGVFPSSGAYEVGGISSSNWNPSTVVTDAMNAANAEVDFSQYDGDNDGYIDCLTIVLPHLSAILEPVRAFVSFGWSGPLFDGKRITTIGFLGYSDLDPESRTVHHEQGHFFNLPDYYDLGGDSAPANPGTDGNESLGVGYWDLMCAGNLTNPPMHMSPYNKWLLNWIEPTVLNTDVQDLVLQPSNDINNPGSSYILWTEGSFVREFFIIENRWQVATSDIGPNPGRGLLVWHVDEDEMINPSSGYGVNDIEEHKALDLEEADGQAAIDHMWNYGDAGDVYPQGTKEFKFTTNPSSANYAGDDTQVRIYNIRKDDASQTVTINAQITSFTFDFNSLPPMIGTGTVDIAPNIDGNLDKVELYLNDALVFEATSPPYSYSWDTTEMVFGQVLIRGIGYTPSEQREVAQDMLVDNTPVLFPFADNAENGFFQIFPLDSRHPSTSLRTSTRQAPGTPEDLANAGTGQWRQRADFKTSGERSFYCGKGAGTYDNFESDYLVTRKINLNGVSTPVLSFSHQYDMEENKDFGRVYITDNNGQTFTQLAQYTGTHANEKINIPLSSWIGKTVRIVFFFESDGTGTDPGPSITGSGWWIDDIVVSNGPASQLPTITIVDPGDKAGVSGSVPIAVTTTGFVSRVDYIVYHSGGTLIANSTTPPYSTTLLTGALRNQRALLEAKAISSGGVYSSDWVEIDLNNLRGDINADGKVDAADVDALAARFGMPTSDPNYRGWFDANGDGSVDERDASMIGYHWGEQL